MCTSEGTASVSSVHPLVQVQSTISIVVLILLVWCSLCTVQIFEYFKIKMSS